MSVTDRYVDLLCRAVLGELETRAAADPDAPPVDAEQGRFARVPRWGYTMVGRRRLESLRDCVTAAIRDGVPGDLIETGVWRGGATILMRGILEAYADSTRTVFVADSFQGVPPPALDADAWSDLHSWPELAISLSEVRAHFARFGLLDDRVQFVDGWFRDTLPNLSDRTWAVVRLDGDLYESTMDGLTNLYPRLSPGGFLIVDDYGAYEACRDAVRDYRAEKGIDDEIVDIDWTGVYWRRSE